MAFLSALVCTCAVLYCFCGQSGCAGAVISTTGQPSSVGTMLTYTLDMQTLTCFTNNTKRILSLDLRPKTTIGSKTFVARVGHHQYAVVKKQDARQQLCAANGTVSNDQAWLDFTCAHFPGVPSFPSSVPSMDLSRGGFECDISVASAAETHFSHPPTFSTHQAIAVECHTDDVRENTDVTITFPAMNGTHNLEYRAKDESTVLTLKDTYHGSPVYVRQINETLPYTSRRRLGLVVTVTFSDPTVRDHLHCSAVCEVKQRHAVHEVPRDSNYDAKCRSDVESSHTSGVPETTLTVVIVVIVFFACVITAFVVWKCYIKQYCQRRRHCDNANDSVYPLNSKETR